MTTSSISTATATDRHRGFLGYLPTNGNPESASDKHGTHIVRTAAPTVAGTLGLAFGIVIVYILWRNRRQRQQQQPGTNVTAPPQTLSGTALIIPGNNPSADSEIDGTELGELPATAQEALQIPELPLSTRQPLELEAAPSRSDVPTDGSGDHRLSSSNPTQPLDILGSGPLKFENFPDVQGDINEIPSVHLIMQQQRETDAMTLPAPEQEECVAGTTVPYLHRL